MSNTLLTPSAITREALRVLHNKVKFIGSIDRQHDGKMEFDGQKNGGTINIRKPPQYTVRTGRTASIQDAEETYTTLTVNTQKGVDMAFTTADMTLSIDDFSKRFISPAMSRLAAQMEADALNMYKDVYNEVGSSGTSPASTTVVLQAKQKLIENLAPVEEEDVFFLQTPGCEATLVGALTGLYNQNAAWGGQYSKGVMTAKEALGFKFLSSALTPRHTNGGATRADGTVNGDVTNGSNSIVLASVGVSSTINKGDILTFTGVYAVNPETKATLSSLQQFVVVTSTTSDGSEAATITVSPTPYFSGAKQNISTQITNSTVCTWSTAAAAVDDCNLAYHPQAFTFATAPLILPDGVDMKARETHDGLSIRLIRQYDVKDDLLITRLDVLYGYTAQRPEWACRILGA